MKRRIKYRVWDIEKKIMYQVDEIRLNNPDNNAHVFIKGRGWLSAGKGILREFTGLHDENGKEIYEGDILRYNYHLGSRNTFDDDFIGEVVYKICEKDCGDLSYRNVGFMLRAKDRGKFWYTSIPDLEDVEVIGNTFENPKLLKESE